MKTPLTILVPVDFSELSRDAFFAAVKLAREWKAQILLLHVLDVMGAASFFLEEGFPDSRIDYLETRLYKEKELEKLEEDPRVKNLSIRTLVVMGVPEKEIVEQARKNKADFIVMSTHGRGGITHFFLGSVSEQVIRHAPCPVMTFNPATLNMLKKEKDEILPKAAEEELPMVKKTDPAGQNKQRTILLVEDDGSFRESMRKLLEKEGYHVIEACSGLKGKELLSENKIDLVFLDLYLGDITGMEWLEVTRSPMRPTVIMLTAFGDWGIYRDALNRGAVDCLQKPVKRSELITLLNRYLGERAVAS